MALAKSVALVLTLIVIGLAFTVLGAVFWGLCAAASSINGLPPNCGPGAIVVTVFGVIFLLIGIGVGVASAYSGPRTIYPTTDPAVPPPVIQPVVVQQTIVQQTVEVRCRYCGSLNAVTGTKCSACGAAL